MVVRGIRGATAIDADRQDLVLAATRELLQALTEANGIEPDDIASVILTATPDITSEYPARAARAMGWHDVPLLGATEMAVPDGLQRCIRVLMHVNTDAEPSQLRHVYLRGARVLRPDR